MYNQLNRATIDAIAAEYGLRVEPYPRSRGPIWSVYRGNRLLFSSRGMQATLNRLYGYQEGVDDAEFARAAREEWRKS